MRELKHAEVAPSPASATRIDRESVKTLAIAVGVREAARQLQLNPNTVLQWSKRDQWFKPTPIPPTKVKQDGNSVIGVISPSDALRATLTERSNNTKLGLSKAAMKAAKHLAESEPDHILKQSRNMRDVAATASTVHGWEAGSRDTGPFSPQAIQILSQRTYLSVGGNPEQQGE